jgi:hypothetical protein
MDQVLGEVDRKRKLCDSITREECSESVVALLTIKDCALPDECELWDYKGCHPDYRDLKGDEESKKAFKADEADIVKDCVAFYNSYGGYILFGFDNKTRGAIGVRGEFDTDEFKKQIEKYTSSKINIVFRYFDLDSATRVGLLLVPKRPYESMPVQFRKPAPVGAKGKQAFAKGSFYLRREAASRPIDKEDDLPFLSVKGRREIHVALNVAFSESLSNNLPARDPGLIELIPRREYLISLEKWFLDSFNGIKLLTGLGGYGKTAIARSFSEILIDNRPQRYESLIWLTAKTDFFVSLQGATKSNSRVDFRDSASFFSAALMELGYLSTEVEGKDKDELVDEFIDLISDLPVILVVDDIDSLDIDEQYILIGDLQKVSSVNVYSAQVPSKLLITSRLDLGVSPELVLPVKGFERTKGFEEYVRMSAASLDIDQKMLGESFLKNLYEASEGAPTFINGILRLIALGDSPMDAIANWKGKDGEDVRRFAFERELSNLDTNAASVLYAAILLNSPTVTAIEATIRISHTALRDAIAKLRQYHLMVQHYDEGRRVAVVHLPESLRLMADVVRTRLSRSNEIERKASQINADLKKFSGSRLIGDVISEVVSRWKSGQFAEALEIANEALNQEPNNKDLLGLVGRAYLKVAPPVVTKSERHLKLAFENGNSRVETINDWIMCKQMQRDWRGLIGVANRVKKVVGPGTTTFHIAMATAKIAENRLLERKSVEAAEKYREAARLARDCLNRFEAEGKTKDLIDLKNACYELCVTAYARHSGSSGGASSRRVWDASLEALKAKTRSHHICHAGLDALTSWASGEVEQPVTAETRDKLAYEAQRLREAVVNRYIHQKYLPQAERALAVLTSGNG